MGNELLARASGLLIGESPLTLALPSPGNLNVLWLRLAADLAINLGLNALLLPVTSRSLVPRLVEEFEVSDL
jgi:hypothetical protein